MQFGLKEKHIKAIKEVLSKYNDIEKSVIYGSRAKGNYEEYSDIDICLYGNIDHSTLTKISMEIDDLLLPYKVDITIFNKIRNEELKKHIERVGVVVV